MSTAVTVDAERAAQLIAMGLRRKHVPHRDPLYRELLGHYAQDGDFAQLVRAIAAGIGLLVLDVNPHAGLVMAPEAASVFDTRLEDHFARSDRSDVDRVLYGIVHLAVAALAFPREDDLADDNQLRRVSVEQIDEVVRDTCRMLDEQVAKDGTDPGDVPLDNPGLEHVWRAYKNKSEIGSTADGRSKPDTTRGIVRRTLRWLALRGLLQPVGDDADEVYRTTFRYQILVRQLAAHKTFQELLALGFVPPLQDRTLSISENDQIL